MRVWMAAPPPEGSPSTARGRVYIAGGPNSVASPGAPDLWVYAPDGRLLAALRTGVANPFLNDVAIGQDGAAYVTNSNAPLVFRVTHHRGRWAISTWSDATGVIPTQAGFNLGGIVVTQDRRALVVAQGNTGRLWRFDLRTRRATPVDTGQANLLNADGLVRRGSTLWVIRNFDRTLTMLRLSRDGTAARPTAPGRQQVRRTGRRAAVRGGGSPDPLRPRLSIGSRLRIC